MKNFIRFSLLASIAACAIAGAQDSSAVEAAKDPAYLQIKRLVGGVWHSGVNGAQVESRWKTGPDGVTLLGETVLTQGGKEIVHMHARFGWDPAAKHVYYLDAHGLDTVYFGHAVYNQDGVDMNFKGLVGDPGEYIFHTTFTSDDSYDAALYDGTGGKPGKVVEKYKWTRTKE
jgi:hypothetical protein